MTWKKLLIAVLLAAVSFGFGAYIRFHRIDVPVVNRPTPETVQMGVIISDDATQTDPEQPDIPEIQIAGRINILVLGEDNIDKVKRSDTMMFVAIDVDDRNVRVLSLPRDTRVAIPRHGNQKLNHAYAYGGVDLLRATIERFLGTAIHYYVKIDYDNFPQLVDIIGGVDIYVGKAMKYTDRKQKLYIDIPVGKQRMNGETALKYVRFRNDAMGDIGRIRRQQQFIKAFLHRIYEAENLLRFPTIINEIKNTLTTDMDPSMILQLGSFVRRLEDEQNRIFFKMLPGQAAMVDGLSYWIAEQRGIEAFLRADTEGLAEIQADVTTQAQYTPDTADGKKKPESETASADAMTPDEVRGYIDNITSQVAILNGTGKAGIAQNASSVLQKMGVDIVHVGNAKHFDYRSTIVVYPEGAQQEMRTSAANLAKLCGIPASLVRSDRQATYVSLIVGHNHASVLKGLDSVYDAIRESH